MKKKGNFRKVVSGLLAGMTMLSAVSVSYTHLKQGEKEENLVDKSPRQSERSGKNIRPSVQKIGRAHV